MEVHASGRGGDVRQRRRPRRLVAAESARQPELAEAFYQAGPALALETTARFFTEMTARGALNVPDPAIAAELDPTYFQYGVARLRGP